MHHRFDSSLPSSTRHNLTEQRGQPGRPLSTSLPRPDPNNVAPRNPEIRERPTKFLRRTTVESKRLRVFFERAMRNMLPF